MRVVQRTSVTYFVFCYNGTVKPRYSETKLGTEQSRYIEDLVKSNTCKKYIYLTSKIASNIMLTLHSQFPTP